MLQFQGSSFFTYAAASHHCLTVWLGLTVYLIYSKVKRRLTATPVEVKPTLVHPGLSPQASLSGIILARITFSLEDQDTRQQLNYTSAGKRKDNDLRE